MKIALLAASISMLALTACESVHAPAPDKPATRPATQTQSPAERLRDLARLNPGTVQQAINAGSGFIAAYADGAAGLKKRRRVLNLGIWAANVYTTGAAGVEAHPDNLLFGSLTGSSLRALDPIINEGGPTTYGEAIAKTSCVMNAGAGATTEEARAVWAFLKVADPNNADARSALRKYDGLKNAIMARYVAVYGNYISSTTAPLVAVERLPVQAEVQGQSEEEEDALEEAEDQQNKREGVFALGPRSDAAEIAKKAEALSLLADGVLEAIRGC